MPDQDVPQDKPSNFMGIPYFAGDQGRLGIERPLKPPTVSYLCPSMTVLMSGVPGAAVFIPGADLDVQVRVANYGGGTINAAANVAVFWADPNTGFTKTNWFGHTPVIVPTHGGVRLAPIIRSKIPITAPKHICLLARVTAPGDYLVPNSIIDPITDRHWAQLNLNAVTLAADSTFQFTFWAGNPLSRTAAFDLVARSVNSRVLKTLSRQFRAEPVAFDEIAINLMPLGVDFARNDRERRRGPRITVELKANARQPIHMHGTLTRRLESSRFTAVEILQISRDNEDRIIGSLGVVVICGS